MGFDRRGFNLWEAEKKKKGESSNSFTARMQTLTSVTVSGYRYCSKKATLQGRLFNYIWPWARTAKVQAEEIIRLGQPKVYPEILKSNHKLIMKYLIRNSCRQASKNTPNVPVVFKPSLVSCLFSNKTFKITFLKDAKKKIDSKFCTLLYLKLCTFLCKYIFWSLKLHMFLWKLPQSRKCKKSEIREPSSIFHQAYTKANAFFTQETIPGLNAGLTCSDFSQSPKKFSLPL